MTAVLTPPATTTIQRFRLSCVPWSAYRKFCEALDGQRIRLTYDRGEMELMTVSPEHERGKSRLRLLLLVLCEELDIGLAGYGSMTCNREDVERGFEPDECYYVAQEALMRGRHEIDLGVDPPPDLALEVEISRSILDRLGICAALGIPELWRYDGRTLRFCLLQPDGTYAEQERGRAFPFLRAEGLADFLTQNDGLNDTQLLRAFRAWVRDRVAQGWQ
jgi:Uma2 family endonuclease